MALPNGAGGYQIGDGNVNEAQLFVQGAPTAVAAAATMTSAQLASGMFVFNGTAGNLTLPTVALLEADISSAEKVNAAFDFIVINADAGSDAVTLATGSGCSPLSCHCTTMIRISSGSAARRRRSSALSLAITFAISHLCV